MLLIRLKSVNSGEGLAERNTRASAGLRDKVQKNRKKEDRRDEPEAWGGAGLYVCPKKERVEKDRLRMQEVVGLRG